MNEGESRKRKLSEIAVGEKLWDIRVVAVKIADHGKRYRVTVTGRTSGKSFTREGFNPKIELLRILSGAEYDKGGKP